MGEAAGKVRQVLDCARPLALWVGPAETHRTVRSVKRNAGPFAPASMDGCISFFMDLTRDPSPLIPLPALVHRLHFHRRGERAGRGGMNFLQDQYFGAVSSRVLRAAVGFLQHRPLM